MTVLLARNRPPPTVAAGVPHADFAEELITLPSGLLAMVCEAIVKLKVRPGGCRACLRALRQRGRWERGRGQCSPLGLVRPTVCGVLGVLPVAPDWGLLRFPMWAEPPPIPSVQALCAVVRD